MLTDGDLRKIGDLVDKKIDLAFDKNLKPIKEDITHIRKDIKRMINFFDREYLELRKRVEKIEKFLKLN